MVECLHMRVSLMRFVCVDLLFVRFQERLINYHY